MNNYFAYVRVSTPRQGEFGVSLRQQRDSISQYAARHQLQITEWFEDQLSAASGSRPGFSKMTDLLERGHATGVIIHKIDCGARNLKDWARLGELIDRGVAVRFAHDSVDMNSRGGRLSADIQAVVAADYIRNLREETIKGFTGRLKQGLYPLAAPLGYLDNGGGKAKTICPYMGPLVRRAFELYASGQYSLRALAEECFYRGLRNRGGGRVTVSGLSLILNNPFYTGMIRIRRTKQMYIGVHRTLVSQSLFDEVQRILNGKRPHSATRHQYLFRRLIRCGHCQRRLIAYFARGHFVISVDRGRSFRRGAARRFG